MVRCPGLVAAVLAVALSGACTSGGGAGGSASPSRPAPTAQDCAAGSFELAGTSTQRAVLSRWIERYRDRCPGASVGYRAGDTRDGLAWFRRGRVTLVGSESGLDDAARSELAARCGAGQVVSLPVALTPVTLVHTVPGVPDLTVTPAVLAKIYARTIVSWNDPEIAAANPGVELPNKPVTPVHGSDRSVATDVFTGFLAARAGDVWTFGAGPGWPVPGGGGVPSARVAQTVAGTDGGIGYVEGPEAQRLGLATAKLDSGRGPVAPGGESVAAAASRAAVEGDDREIRLAVDLDLDEPDAYPLLLVSYQITCAEGLPPAKARFAKTFLAYATGEGQAVLAGLGAAPLPSRLLSRVRTEVGSLSGS